MSPPPQSEVARMLDVFPDTLRRWTREGIVPLRDGEWTPAAIAQARIVARLRRRGHSLDELREAAHTGRLAYGCMEELFPPRAETRFLRDAARESGLEEALIRCIWSAAGFSATTLEEGISEDDGELRPLPRIGVHAGGALYRDGDYYGRAVNLASRVGARAAGGEVLVTRPVVEAAGRHLAFRHLGEVRMKGFAESTELFLASAGEP